MACDSFPTTRFICPGSIQIYRIVTMRLCFVLSGRTSVLLERLRTLFRFRPFSPFQEKYEELKEVCRIMLKVIIKIEWKWFDRFYHYNDRPPHFWQMEPEWNAVNVDLNILAQFTKSWICNASQFLSVQLLSSFVHLWVLQYVNGIKLFLMSGKRQFKNLIFSALLWNIGKFIGVHLIQGVYFKKVLIYCAIIGNY